MSRVVSTDGCEIHYDVTGNGPVVVFVPGFMGVSAIWQNQVGALQEQYRCISLDNRGFGRSEAPLPGVAYDIDQLVTDVAAVLDDADVREPAVLVGHSLGGSTISSFCLEHPERVSALAYVGCHVSGPQLASLGDSIVGMHEALSSPGRRAEFYVSYGLPPELAAETAKWPLHGLLSMAHTMLVYDIGDRFSEISVPALVLHGRDDVTSPWEPCATGLVDALPDVRLVALPGVNHFPSVEAPEQTTAALLDFLQEIQRDG